ncbi:succinylglutamate desuccinylase/aspartoacylase family protein [Aquabacterium sp.]|uniref:succinylglutamate desuccinylase/aspartoacylase domain-containing protein n=1 Tax=Aquabacterium sp. TaxID=1872578 RepID=UPI003783B707
MRPLQAIHYATPNPGPKLIVTGAVHGNETCGTRAIERVLAEIDNGQLVLARGEVSFVPVCNPKAYELKRRQGDRNLNRKLSPTTEIREYEDHVANWLCPLLARHEVLLDLHSFHTGGEPFAMVGPENNDGPLEPFRHAEREAALVLRLGVRRIVDGWLSTYAGGVARRRQRAELTGQHGLETDPDFGVGTTEYMRRVGGWGFTLECGQHEDPAAPEVAYTAILNTLAHLKIIDAPDPAPVAAPQALSLYKVVDKIDADDHFARHWQSFDAVPAGTLIGTRADGTPVHADEDSAIVFPNPAAGAGQEWFYLARGNKRF